MSVQYSDETRIELAPRKFALNEQTKVVTFIPGEPPSISGRGRRANPIIGEIYTNLMTNRKVWAHVNIPITNRKQQASMVAALYARARKDSLSLSTRSYFNDRTKLIDLWVMIS